MAIVQAKTRLYIPCQKCVDGSWRGDHLSIGFKTEWACEKCHRYFKIERVKDDMFRVELVPGKMETPVTVTLESATIPKITLKLNAWKYGHSQKDTQEEYESNQEYYYNDHTCPTNWTSQIEQIIFEGGHRSAWCFPICFCRRRAFQRPKLGDLWLDVLAAYTAKRYMPVS